MKDDLKYSNVEILLEGRPAMHLEEIPEDHSGQNVQNQALHQNMNSTAL